MNIEEYIIQYLEAALPVHVYGDVPSPVPDQFVTVEQTGSGMENKISSARIAVQSWSISRDQASQLNKQVEAVMDAITAEPEISSCSRDTSYNFPDLTRKKPRYQAIFTVVYYLN